MALRTWVLQQQGELFDVLRNGRRLQSDLTEASARAWVRRRRAHGERVFEEEPSGYRREITSKI